MEEKIVFFGIDIKIEIIVNVKSDEEIIVFHAMGCRKIFRDRIIK